MDRRDFFKFGLSKSTETVSNVAKANIDAKFRREIIRPPGAISEMQFLLSCTRCGDCKTACPHNAIHLVDALTAGALNKTPFIDPVFKACQFCEDMPCIQSCEPQALKMPEEGLAAIKIAIAAVNPDHCLVAQGQRCDYCFKSCPKGINAISKAENGVPFIDADLCVGCGKCAYICVSQTGTAIEMVPV